MEILTPILIVGIIGLLAGVILAVASIVMAVPKDEKAEALEEVLPGATGCPGLRGGHGQGRGPAGPVFSRRRGGGPEVRGDRRRQRLVQVEYNRLGPLLGQLRQHHRQDAVRRHPKLLSSSLPHGGRHQLPLWLHGPGGLPAGLPVPAPSCQRPGPRPSAAPSRLAACPRGLSLWCP